MSTQIQAIKVQRLYLQVAQQLQQLIASGEFEVGKRLPAERDLASQFGVSRPTIREAMIALEIAGLVETVNRHPRALTLLAREVVERERLTTTIARVTRHDVVTSGGGLGGLPAGQRLPRPQALNVWPSVRGDTVLGLGYRLVAE